MGILFCVNIAIGQKQLVSVKGEDWQEGYDHYLISNNGRYIAYEVYSGVNRELYMMGVDSSGRIAIPGASLTALTQDNRYLVFRTGDSLGMMDLKAPDVVTYIKGVITVADVKQGRDRDLLFYRTESRPDRLVIRQQADGKEMVYEGVSNYWTSDDGNAVVLELVQKAGAGSAYALDWIDIQRGDSGRIWEGPKVEDLKMGHGHEQCVFMADAGADSVAGNSIWVYHHPDKKAVKVLDDRSESLKGMVIRDLIAFNDLSDRIFFDIGQPEAKQPVHGSGVSVDIWSYKDAVLQSEQLAGLKAQGNGTASYKAVMKTGDHQLIRLEHEHENVQSDVDNDRALHYVVLIKSGGGDGYEWNWNSRSRKQVYLVDLDNGKRRLIGDHLPADGIYSYVLSFNERYLFYYDPGMKGYYSYRISDGARRNLTAGIQGQWITERTADEPDGMYLPCGLAGLIRNKDAILIYDQHDLYRLDPESNVPVKNLTGRSGQPKDLIFRVGDYFGVHAIDSNERVCLSVLNKATKEACLTGMSVNPASAAGSLHFEPYIFNSRSVVKARDREAFIVERMSAEEHPNLFFTSDFRTYTAITDIYPERGYNWMTTELVTWKTYDGGISQGILYKPENFDAHRKYPLLVYYYERLSDNLHRFMYPGLSDGLLNIPYYVSNGYLVFVPDIHYRVGWPGRSAYNCVVSGVEYLAGKGYVDVRRMGLQGHSFGGFETNYIITHSTLFAAAMSASGVSNFTSIYGSLIGGSEQTEWQFELRQGRIGATLWSGPGLYIENSPVFRADKVTTPLLMLTDYADDDVPCQQGIEFFTGLRRLGKRVWMLQYDGEGHNVFSREAEGDLTIRMAQFFNYYLKGEKPPRWMTVGVPANLKGIDSGLQADSSRLVQ